MVDPRSLPDSLRMTSPTSAATTVTHACCRRPMSSIEVTTRDGNGDWGGRVVDMAFDFEKGRVATDGDTVRSYLGLNSDWFTFSVAPRQKGPAR